MTDIIETTITEYTRFPNTPDGNPRWTIETEGGKVYATDPDAQAGHVVNDQRYPARARLTLNAQGRVRALEYLEG